LSHPPGTLNLLVEGPAARCSAQASPDVTTRSRYADTATRQGRPRMENQATGHTQHDGAEAHPMGTEAHLMGARA